MIRPMNMIPLDSLAPVSGFLPKLLTALTVLILGGWAYEARDGFILSFGSLRGKIFGAILVLVTLSVGLFVTPSITGIWSSIVEILGNKRTLGVVVILAMVATNNIAEWNYLDSKSILVYLGGLALLFHSKILSAIPVPF